MPRPNYGDASDCSSSDSYDQNCVCTTLNYDEMCTTEKYTIDDCRYNRNDNQSDESVLDNLFEQLNCLRRELSTIKKTVNGTFHCPGLDDLVKDQNKGLLVSVHKLEKCIENINGKVCKLNDRVLELEEAKLDKCQLEDEIDRLNDGVGDKIKDIYQTLQNQKTEILDLKNRLDFSHKSISNKLDNVECDVSDLEKKIYQTFDEIDEKVNKIDVDLRQDMTNALSTVKDVIRKLLKKKLGN